MPIAYCLLPVAYSVCKVGMNSERPSVGRPSAISVPEPDMEPDEEAQHITKIGLKYNRSYINRYFEEKHRFVFSSYAAEFVIWDGFGQILRS